MEAHNSKPSLDSGGSNPEHVLRDSQTLADTKNPLQDPNMKCQLAAFRVTNFWRSTGAECSEMEIEDQLEMSGEENIPGSQTVYAAPEDVQQVIEAVLSNPAETRLHRLINDIVNKKIPPFFKDANRKARNGT